MLRVVSQHQTLPGDGVNLMMSQDTLYILFFGLVVSLLPLWVGYRRKIAILPMMLIMIIGGLIPLAGWIIGLYIACRAKSHIPKPEDTSTGSQTL